MAEMHLDATFSDEGQATGETGSTKRSAASLDDEGDSNIIVKLPQVGDIKRSGNCIYCGDVKTGSISYLTHWDPAAIAANCHIHGSDVCYFTMPLLGTEEDEMIRWLGEAGCYRNAKDHLACIPDSAYNRRVRKR